MADGPPAKKSKTAKAEEVAELKKQMELMQSMLENQRKEIEEMRAKKATKPAAAAPAASPRKAAAGAAASTPTRRKSGGGRDLASPGGVEAEPSRVLHVRDLPADAANDEVAALLAPFGLVEKMVFLEGKHQALIQLADVAAATRALAAFKDAPAEIRTQSVSFAYSVRRSLTAAPRQSLSPGGPGRP